MIQKHSTDFINPFRYSQINLKKNKPPSGGSCSISPTNSGFCLLSPFTIHCESWDDPEGFRLSAFNFRYTFNGTDGTVKEAALASISHETIEARMPLGEFRMYVDVTDSFGAATSHFIGVITTTMPSEQMYKAFNGSAKLAAVSAEGDPSKLAMFIKGLNSLMANAEWTQISADALQNKTDEERDSLMQDISEARSQQLKTMLTSSPPTTSAELNVYAQVLTSAVDQIQTNPLAAQTVSFESRDDTVTNLESLARALPQIPVGDAKEYLPFIKSALGVISSVSLSLTYTLENNDSIPVTDRKNAINWDYEGAISEDVNEVVPDSIEEMIRKNILRKTRDQCITMVNRMENIMENIRNTVLPKLAKGQSIMTRSEDGSSAFFSKQGEEILKKKSTVISAPVDGNSSVTIPKNFCPSKYIDPHSICRVEFGISMVVWPLVMHFYPGSRKFLAKKTSVIDVTITSENTVVTVENAPRPIQVEIPRDPGDIVAPVQVNVSDTISPGYPLVYHYFNVTYPQAAILIDVAPSRANEALVLLLSHERFPIPGNFLFSFLISEWPKYSGFHSVFINTDENKNRTGRFVAAIGRLLNNANPSNFTKEDLDPNFSSNYKFRITVAGCYFFNRSLGEWSGQGLKVIAANATHTKCETYHLSQFGTGFLPTVNAIDFNFLVANMGFVDHSTLYAVIILVLVIFIVMILWAHYKDKKDVSRRGAHPLPDNKPENKYIYEVTFFTGPDSDATCESNIYFLIAGDYEESGIRCLPTPTLNLYRRYDRNTFVMTTATPLGPLQYLRVFHDNSGRPPYDSWQIDRVVFRDLQNLEQYTFETVGDDCWLSLDRGDGNIDRMYLSNNEEAGSFSDKMYFQTNRAANQDHVWMAPFLRPIGSRYCRKERISVCTVFLCLSMLINALFYEVEADSPVDAFYYIGPIPLAYSQIVTGILVILVVLPLTSMLAVLFKRARPKNYNRCRALEAIEQQRKEQLVDSGIASDEAGEKGKVDEVADEASRMKVMPVIKCLPWWTRVIGWAVCVITILGSLFFVWAYGIMWGEITTVKWFSSFFTTFIISIMITQFLKIVIMSCFGSTCMPADLSIDDIDCDEEVPHLKEDEEWLKMTPLDTSAPRHVHRVTGVTHKVKRTGDLNVTLTKERDMKFVVRGIFIYSLFLVVLLIIVNDKTPYEAYLMQKHLRNTFIKDGHLEYDVGTKVSTELFSN